MKVLAFLLDDDYTIDVFIRQNEERLKSAEASASVFIKEMLQKKTILPDGKALLVVVFDYTILDFTPRWIARIGLKQGLRNAGYKGAIQKVSYKKAIAGLLR